MPLSTRLAPGWLHSGPFGIAWSSPEGLFGLTGWSRLGRAVGASLFVGTLATVIAALWRREAPRRVLRGLDVQTLRDAERTHIARVLEAVRWNKKEAARVLAISRGTLYRKILDYGLERGGGPDRDTPLTPAP